MVQLTDETLAHRLAWRVRAHPGAAAYLQKRHGVWRAWTWSEFGARVRATAAGLRSAGLSPGDAVGIASGSRVEAVVAIHACQHAGLVPVLLNANLAAGGLATMAQRAGIVALIAEDQEQVDKFADVQSRLPQVRAAWVVDPKGTHGYSHVRVQPFDALGATDDDTGPATRGGVPGVGLFSAGVHREPRYVPVAHADLLRLQAVGKPLGLVEAMRCATLFGLADPLGHFMMAVAPVLFGVVPCFGESRLPAVAELRQCAPELVALPARLLDQLRRETSARAGRTRGLQQQLIQRWIARGGPGGWLHAIVGRPVAAALGLAACRTVVTGYERMTPVSARFLARLGITTRGLYGLAEAGGPVAAFDQADAPALRMFDGYGAEVAGGQLAVQFGMQRVTTGDLVDLAGGELHLVGREAEMLMLPDGSRVAPSVIEAELQASPYVSQAVAVGGPAGGVVALVELDEVTLREWARTHGLAFTTLRSLADSSEVARLIEQAVAEANQRLAAAMRIGRVLLLPRALDAANGELTPALALRRAIVRNRYAHRLVAGGMS
jgi:long-chain acyl-CoA synthetase